VNTPEAHALFQQIAILLAVAAGIGALGALLRQPLIISFIAVGVLMGPSVLGVLTPDATIALLSQIGIALLLFVVGLKLDLQHIRTTGPVALATGLGQVIFTSVIGYIIARALGFAWLPALYIAVALTFSSTIIIVKLLSDKRELDELHGRIAVGFLIVQDIVVVLVMIALGALGGAEEDAALGRVVVLAGSGLAVLAVLAALMKWVFPPLLQWLARSHELLVLFAIAWAVALAAVGETLGFGAEVGAFLAGMSLASTRFREAIGARLITLRDFLLLFFFLELGTGLNFGEIGSLMVPALIFSVFVLVGNPLIVLIIMGLMGYRARVSFLAGLTVAQISEFSLILAALGLSLGHIDADVMGMITAVGLITIALSTYMILYSHPLYDRLAPVLRIFQRKLPQDDRRQLQEDQPQVIIFGVGRHGGAMIQALKRMGLRVMGVDYDPQAVSEEKLGIPLVYGDAEDPEFPGLLPLRHAEWVVSAIPGRDANVALLQALRNHGYRRRVMLTARDENDAHAVLQEGADEVVRPYVEAAERAVRLIAATCNISDDAARSAVSRDAVD
jgi:Kef-type K+ transport system membrane component KefB